MDRFEEWHDNAVGSKALSMSLTFAPLHPVFVAECSGVDIGRPILPTEPPCTAAGTSKTRSIPVICAALR